MNTTPDLPSTSPAPAAVVAPPAAPASAAPAPPPRPAHADGDDCPNCGAAMWGEFCFACGQPRKGLIRRITSVMGDFLDTVFSIDNRLWRTLAPLYFLPGQLTVEYVAGRRVRYVTPFRLFFFLCVLSFLALKVYTANTPGAIDFGEGDEVRIESAKTVAEVDVALAKALEGIDEGRKGLKVGLQAAGTPPVAVKRADENMARAEKALRETAEARKAWIAEAEKARAEGREPPPDPAEDEDVGISFGDEPWDAEKNPIAIAWLPDAVNDNLNQRMGRAEAALKHAREDPSPLIEAFFGAIPPATFMMVPLFALLLKGLYVFKRRLYMEHLLAVLHTHAFIFLSLLLISLALLAQQTWGATRPWLASTTDTAVLLMAWWVPIHLLVAQRRIYRQNWFATVFKFCLTGFAYIFLLSFGLLVAVLLGLLSL
jgi:hypothetical protein